MNYKLRIKNLILLFTIYYLLVANFAFAATNISSSDRYAWNDNIGWIDFYSTNNLNVFYDRLEGYASSSVGDVAFNCNSTPNGDICTGPAGNWKTSNDGSGHLSGWAWNDLIGWISLDSATAGSSYFYQAVINFSTGEFSGWAWNDVAGWISFNCSNTSTCGTLSYKVSTAWNAIPVVSTIISSIFDTNAIGGGSINSITWKGLQLSGTSVKFQVASSNNSSGPWTYIGPGGTSAETDVYSAAPNITMPVNLSHHNNKRYVRYKAYLSSNAAKTETPTVYDIIINWSP